VGFVRQNMPEPEAGFALDDKEFLSFAVMVMPPTGDARIRREIRELAGIRRFKHLDEHPTFIAMPGQVISETARWQITDLGGIQRTHQAGPDRFGNKAGAAIPKRTYLLC
jgi:hypothetical protein